MGRAVKITNQSQLGQVTVFSWHVRRNTRMLSQKRKRRKHHCKYDNRDTIAWWMRRHTVDAHKVSHLSCLLGGTCHANQQWWHSFRVHRWDECANYGTSAGQYTPEVAVPGGVLCRHVPSRADESDLTPHAHSIHQVPRANHQISHGFLIAAILSNHIYFIINYMFI